MTVVLPEYDGVAVSDDDTDGVRENDPDIVTVIVFDGETVGVADTDPLGDTLAVTVAVAVDEPDAVALAVDVALVL